MTASRIISNISISFFIDCVKEVHFQIFLYNCFFTDSFDFKIELTQPLLGVAHVWALITRD